MNDKLYIILMILCIGVGLVAYDRHTAQNGGDSVVAEILDITGLSQWHWERQNKVNFNRKTFSMNTSDYLNRLKGQYKSLEEKREELTSKREAIMNQLIELNDKSLERASHYFEIFEKEKAAFLSEFEQLKDIGQKFTAVVNSDDPAKQAELFASIKQDLLDVLDQVAVSEESREEFLAIFGEIESIILSAEDVVIEDCGDRTSCLEQKVKTLENDVASFVDSQITDPENGLKNLINLSQQLDQEYREILQGFDEQELNYEINKDEVTGQFHSLIKQMVQGTEEDLYDLAGLYQQLFDEQEFMTKELARQYLVLTQTQESISNQLQRALGELESSSSFEENGLIEQFESFSLQQEQLLNNVYANGEEIKDLLEAQFVENQTFIENVGHLVEVDVKKMLSDKEYSFDTVYGYVTGRLGKDTFGKISDGSQGMSQRDRQQNIDEHLKRMRRKAKDLDY